MLINWCTPSPYRWNLSIYQWNLPFPWNMLFWKFKFNNWFRVIISSCPMYHVQCITSMALNWTEHFYICANYEDGRSDSPNSFLLIDSMKLWVRNLPDDCCSRKTLWLEMKKKNLVNSFSCLLFASRAQFGTWKRTYYTLFLFSMTYLGLYWKSNDNYEKKLFNFK